MNCVILLTQLLLNSQQSANIRRCIRRYRQAAGKEPSSPQTRADEELLEEYTRTLADEPFLLFDSGPVDDRIFLQYADHHHHYVPSVVNRSAVMDLHRSRSCATLILSCYDIFFHSLMLSVHIVLGPPRPLLPFILPSISSHCTPFPLIIFLLLCLQNIDISSF